jgi:NAD(P)-dependent dehydrogenase (short-subunit alcohol dehydrogenase family)
VARGEERLRNVAAEHPNISWLAASVETATGRRGIVTRTRVEMGPITLLVHAAARGGYHDRPIHQMSLRDWNATMRVNLDAAFDLTRMVALDMIAERIGGIAMVSSVAAWCGAYSKAAYSTSKAALLGLVRSVAYDLATYGVTCNAICPGWVRETGLATEGTRLFAEQSGVSAEDIWRERASHYPDGRLVSIDEVVRATMFVLCQPSAGVNGEAITIAHGGTW